MDGTMWNVDCVHAVCAGGSCLYVPDVPTLGPELPRQVRASDGTLWTSHGGHVYYWQRPGGGYGIATWSDLCREDARRSFPAGPWEVTVA